MPTATYACTTCGRKRTLLRSDLPQVVLERCSCTSEVHDDMADLVEHCRVWSEGPAIGRVPGGGGSPARGGT